VVLVETVLAVVLDWQVAKVVILHLMDKLQSAAAAAVDGVAVRFRLLVVQEAVLVLLFLQLLVQLDKVTLVVVLVQALLQAVAVELAVLVEMALLWVETAEALYLIRLLD
jgi:hypothetical protein